MPPCASDLLSMSHTPLTVRIQILAPLKFSSKIFLAMRACRGYERISGVQCHHGKHLKPMEALFVEQGHYL
jgi:hypothetical protein